MQAYNFKLQTKTSSYLGTRTYSWDLSCLGRVHCMLTVFHQTDLKYISHTQKIDIQSIFVDFQEFKYNFALILYWISWNMNESFASGANF